ncbi:MAG: hypothetical protein K2J82_07400 [Muribaculaceae bacterium]|nr:hypothetical protein [Muribaculaceae bacterium]
MHFVIILIILILVWLIFGSRISAWLKRKFNQYLTNKTEDFIRNATGMPPRPGSRADKRSRKNKSSRSQSSESSSSSGSHSGYRAGYGYGYSSYDTHIIPPEYAEDVEFTEIKEFSQTDIEARFSDGQRVEYHESQVSDVEWVEIKDNNENNNSSRKKRR